MAEFLGFVRPDGQVGVRNHVLVLSAMDNSNPTVRRIAAVVPVAVPMTVQYGRGQYGRDAELTFQTQVGLACNPNVAAVLVVSLEPVSAAKLAEAIASRSGKPVEAVAIQTEGGTLRTVEAGVRRVQQMVRAASRLRREPVPLSQLILGVECGGTDTTSGIAGNPAIGWVSDRLVAAGGSIYMSETSEFLGAEHVLAERAANPEVARRVIDIVQAVESEARRRGVDIRGANPVPDNIRGGITTIEEKSLGAILKGGTSRVMGVLDFGQRRQGPHGLWLMDTPAPAAESVTGLVAGGAQVICFSTGVGNPSGAPLAPVIKITGNPDTAARLTEHVDVDVTGLTFGRQTLDQAGEHLWQELMAVINGGLTCSETLGEAEAAIPRIEPTV